MAEKEEADDDEVGEWIGKAIAQRICLLGVGGLGARVDEGVESADQCVP